ncbi:RING finger protein 170-like [Pelomyxa schiedti]|nr:RING finger protein 170-like [Pelomyxa schiedti]
MKTDTECAVCLGEVRFPAFTSCGHWFCSECILSVWERGDTSQPVLCPMDRAKVSSLVPSRLVLDSPGPSHPSSSLGPAASSSSSATMGEEEKLYASKFSAYNDRFSGRRGTMDRLTDARGLGAWLLRSSVVFRTLVFVSLAFAVCYLMLPRDLLPSSEYGMFIGSLDNIALVIVLLWALYGYIEYKRRKSVRDLELLVQR